MISEPGSEITRFHPWGGITVAFDIDSIYNQYMAKSKVITLTISEKLLKAVDKRAKSIGITRAELMRAGCRQIVRSDQEDVQYWEDSRGSFGLHFPRGIEAGEFLGLMEKYEARKENRKRR